MGLGDGRNVVDAVVDAIVVVVVVAIWIDLNLPTLELASMHRLGRHHGTP